MSLNQFLNCPDDCSSPLILGAIPAKQDCTAYKQKYSQVKAVFILPDGAPLPTDWTQIDDWVAVINNNATTNDLGRYLFGEGEIPAPEETVSDYADRQQKVDTYRYTINHTIKNLEDLQYDFLKLLQCGDTNFSFWYLGIDDDIFGGPSGICPLSVKVTFPRGGGRDDKESAVLSITWEADGDPERAAVPGIFDALEETVLTAVALGPVVDGDTAFGPTVDGDTIFGYLS
jgi:hypothetical protein